MLIRAASTRGSELQPASRAATRPGTPSSPGPSRAIPLVPRAGPNDWGMAHALTAAATLAGHHGVTAPQCVSYGEPGWASSTAGTAATWPSSSGRMVVACRFRMTTSAWSTYPFSVYSAPSSWALSAYSYSLPALAGGWTQGQALTTQAQNDQNPRRMARVF